MSDHIPGDTLAGPRRSRVRRTISLPLTESLTWGDLREYVALGASKSDNDPVEVVPDDNSPYGPVALEETL